MAAAIASARALAATGKEDHVPSDFIKCIFNPAAVPAYGFYNIACIESVEDVAGVTTITMLTGKTVTDTRTLIQWARIFQIDRVDRDVDNTANPAT